MPQPFLCNFSFFLLILFMMQLFFNFCKFQFFSLSFIRHNSSLGVFIGFLKLLLFAWSFHSLLPFFLQFSFLLILLVSFSLFLMCTIFWVLSYWFPYASFPFHVRISLWLCDIIFIPPFVLRFFFFFCIICSILQFPMSNVYETFSKRTCI